MPYFAFTEDVSPDGSNFLIATNEKGFSRPPAMECSGAGRIAPSPARRGKAGLFTGRELGGLPDSGRRAMGRPQRRVSRTEVGLGTTLPQSRCASSADGSSTLLWSCCMVARRKPAPVRDHGRLWEVSSSGANLHEVIPGWHLSSSQCCGTWTPDGRLFVFLDNAVDRTRNRRSGRSLKGAA